MGPSDRNVLEVQGLTVRFDTSERSVVAVKDLGFHVRAGEVLAIVGESGSGKSVTSLSVMRLIEHGGGTIASGKISFTRRNGGKLDLAKAADSVMRTIRGGEISMIFQEPMTSLNPVFSVGTQVAEAVMLHQGLSHAEAEAEALRMLELVRIPEAKQILKRYPHQLSGGMRQRVMIAMALSCKPSLLIADEPTTALDVTIQAQILQLIRQLQEEMGMAVIFITHDMGVVAEVADRVSCTTGKRWKRAPVSRFSTTRATPTRNPCWRQSRASGPCGGLTNPLPSRCCVLLIPKPNSWAPPTWMKRPSTCPNLPLPCHPCRMDPCSVWII